MMHRFLRLSAFAAGLLVGAASVVFAYSNEGRVTVGWWRLHHAGIPLWTVALAPLVVGVGAGYLYHLPARLHHFHEHMRHRHLVHLQEKEIRELKHTLDRLVGAPDERDAQAPSQAADVVELPPRRAARRARRTAAPVDATASR